jgi:hypothetical protein
MRKLGLILARMPRSRVLAREGEGSAAMGGERAPTFFEARTTIYLIERLRSIRPIKDLFKLLICEPARIRLVLLLAQSAQSEPEVSLRMAAL